MRAGNTARCGVLVLGAAAGLIGAGCRGGSDGNLFIVTGGGGSSAPTGSSTTPGTFTLVKSDPGGGTIVQSADGKTRKIAGTFHESTTLEAKYTWVLDAPTFIGDSDSTLTPTLTIEAGTTIQGRGGTPPAMLVIRRGAKIMAQGTPQAPIVFTSTQPVGSRAPGDWGGLVINGRAPVNTIGPGGELPLGEGASGKYGGNDPHDNSGVLRYVRVEFGGHVFTSDDELNGIAFQGVGDATTVDFVQVHRNSDDGVEFFGGTVNARHVLVTGCQDDSLDWTSGWTGRVQFVVLHQWSGGADNAVEADNLEANHGATPRSHPLISNMTIVGPATAGALGKTGMRLRRGTAANISNSILVGLNEWDLDIDDVATWNLAYSDAPGSYNTLSGQLTVENVIFFDAAQGSFADDAADPQKDSVFNGHQTRPNQVAVDPQLTSLSETTPDLRPKAGSPALALWVDPHDAFFQVVTYGGAMDATTDWTAGWSSFPPN